MAPMEPLPVTERAPAVVAAVLLIVTAPLAFVASAVAFRVVKTSDVIVVAPKF